MLKNKENQKLIIFFIIATLLIKSLLYIFKLSNNSFFFVISCAITIFLLKNIYNNKNIINKKHQYITAFYSVLYSTALFFQTKIKFTSISQTYKDKVFENFAIQDLFKFVIIFICVYIVLSNIIILINKCPNYTILKSKKKINKFKYWVLATILTAFPFMLYLFTYAPGSFLGDSLASFMQIINVEPYNNHHPILYTLFVGIFVKIGQAFNNYNIGIFLYSITQILIISSIIGYFLLWLNEKGVKKQYIILTYLFFVANTMFSSYAIILWKDPLFCSFIFLMCLYLFDIINENGKQLKTKKGIIYFVLLSTLIAFLRNNGIYIIIILFISLFCYFKSKYIKFHLINLSLIIIILIIQGPIYNKLHLKTPTEESLAIPLQQIAYTISDNGKIDEKQAKVITKIMSIEKWKENYRPYIVDHLKWNKNFNKNYLQKNKLKFLKTYLQLLPHNFDKYLKAYLLETYGFWSIETKYYYGFIDTYIIENDYNIHQIDIIKKITKKSLKNIFLKPDFLGSGTLFWITIFSSFILIIKKKNRYILVLSPLLASWLSIMIATPVAFSLRYVFMFAYALPLIIMLPFITKDSHK